MRIEDALLYLVLDAALAASPDGPAVCEAAVASGADVLLTPAGVTDLAAVRALVAVGRRADALVLVADDPRLAVAADADGVHLGAATESLGLARGVVGARRLVGMTARTTDDAWLALKVGADYVLQHGPLAGLRGTRAFAGVPVFAAGRPGLEAARDLVAQGGYRLALDTAMLAPEQVAATVADYARLLGRSV